MHCDFKLCYWTLGLFGVLLGVNAFYFLSHNNIIKFNLNFLENVDYFREENLS